MAETNLIIIATKFKALVLIISYLVLIVARLAGDLTIATFLGCSSLLWSIQFSSTLAGKDWRQSTKAYIAADLARIYLDKGLKFIIKICVCFDYLCS